MIGEVSCTGTSRDKHQGLFQYNCQSCDYGNDDHTRFAHHMFKKHGGVEIEGIVK